MNPPADDSDIEDSPLGADEFEPQELDELFDALSSVQRRCAIRSLYDAGGTASFDELVGDVARRTVTRPVDRTDRKQVATSLYHVHLPKLESAGLVTEYDSDGDVELADRVDTMSLTLFESS